jgi:signal peptidase II
VRGQRPLLAWFVGLTALAVVVDPASKWAAERWLAQRPAAVVGGWVQLRLVYNERSAWGLLPAANLWLIGAAVVLCAVVLLSTREVLGRDRRATAALALLVGGGAGNTIDRVRLGAVVDFVDLRVWPVFNLADVAVTVGVVLLAIHLIMRSH